MALEQLLSEMQEPIVQQWMQYALEVYSEDAELLFGSEKDPFANPVGTSIRSGTEEAFGALLTGADAEAISQHLSGIIQIRAVQQFPASEGLSFVFRLKDAARKVLAENVADPDLAADWVDFDRKIDEIALASFDVYGEYRKQVYELRVNEAKRSVSWVIEKMGERDDCSDPDPADGADDTSE